VIWEKNIYYICLGVKEKIFLHMISKVMSKETKRF